MLLTDCEHYFHTDNLYDILHVERTATASEIKKGYYKQSMKWHPDKAATDADSAKMTTVKFQIITKAYEILSDKEKRALYDETGTVDEENLYSTESINVWRRVFKKVTAEDIEKFCVQYKGSEEEESDIVAAYNMSEGDMSKIMDSIMGTAFDDEDRIKEIINRNISNGILKKTSKYRTSTSKAASMKRRRKGMKEAKEAEALKEVTVKEAAGSLEEVIQQRQLTRSSNMDSFLDTLALKYGPKNKRAKK